jgi:hypothetical protein
MRSSMAGCPAEFTDTGLVKFRFLDSHAERPVRGFFGLQVLFGVALEVLGLSYYVTRDPLHRAAPY